MTSEDKTRLAALVAAELRDSAYPGTDIDRTARIIVDRIGPWLHQLGWMPPETSGKIHEWGRRLGEIPEHHVSRATLNSRLCELWDIV